MLGTRSARNPVGVDVVIVEVELQHQRAHDTNNTQHAHLCQWLDRVKLKDNNLVLVVLSLTWFGVTFTREWS